MPLRYRFAAIAGCLLAPFTFPVAPASAQIASGNTVYACVRIDRDADEGKITRIVAATEPCRKNETRLFWNVTGPTGPAGPQGPTGPAGPQGPTGAAGAQGPAGTAGAQGPAGTAGAQGPAGTTGPQGIQGPQGPAGQDGASFKFRGAFDPTASYLPNDVVMFQGSGYIAVGIPAVGGAPGTDPAWVLLVAKGDTGAPGADGAPGAAGPPGPQGAKGDTGATGSQGPTGDTGATGPAGPAVSTVTCTLGTFISSINNAGIPLCSALGAANLSAGTLSTAVGLNQDGLTAFGTGSLTVTTSTFTDVPGLSTSVTAPANGLVYVATAGGTAPAATCTAATCSIVVDVLLIIDGAVQAHGAFQRVYVLDNTAVWGQPNGNWSLSQVVNLAPGIHTIKLQARLAGSLSAPSGALVSGGDGSALQGQLSVLLLRK